MTIAIKLGRKQELMLLRGYEGVFRNFEIPSFLLKETVWLEDLIGCDFIFNVHGSVMPNKEEVKIFQSVTKADIDKCSQWGIKDLILHGAVKEDAGDNKDDEELVTLTLKNLSEICKHTAKRNVNCLLENGGYYNANGLKYREITSLPEHHLALAERLGVGIVLDLGHAALSSSQNGYELKEFIGPYFESGLNPKIIHFSDNFLEDDDHVAIGEGKADIDVYEAAIEKWPEAMMTVENFPDMISKSLYWLVKRSNGCYKVEDVGDLCEAMGWETTGRKDAE